MRYKYKGRDAKKKTHKEVNGDQDDFERKEGETHVGMTLVLFIRARRWRGAAGNPEAIAEAEAEMKMRSNDETMNPRNNPETFCGGQKHLRLIELINLVCMSSSLISRSARVEGILSFVTSHTSYRKRLD
jgi:hypothetical protein